MWDPSEEFDFDVVDSPQELEALIRGKAAGGLLGAAVRRLLLAVVEPATRRHARVATCRSATGRCPGTRSPTPGKLAKGIPKSNYWASDPGGIEQVGCVYTAQGFEYDYAGVIFGRDLVWRPRKGWVGQPEYSHDTIVKRAAKDPARFTDLVKNTYRVLLTRGLRGCYVYFEDDQTRDFVLSRVEWSEE